MPALPLLKQHDPPIHGRSREQVDLRRTDDRRSRTLRPIDVTFAEVRRHLGVETKRQWSDAAIARTTPALLGLFSLITLWANEPYAADAPAPRTASWYPKPLPTFSDALATVRRELWPPGNFGTSSHTQDDAKISHHTIDRLINLACYAA